MSAGAQAAAGGTGERGESACWCCGKVTAEDALVRLGKHPEVGVCVSCVRYLNRKARDYQASVLRQQLRGAAESVRGEVTARGWHQRPVVGPILQWISRHSPW
jgi:hypothetical protein